MHAAHNAYRRSTAMQWSRIDLLVALYGATARTLQEGAEALARNDQPEVQAGRLILANRQLLALLEGVQAGPEGGAENVKRLLIYCLNCVTRPSAAAWRDAGQILLTLHSAFSAIQEEGRQLEQQGEVPSFDAEIGRAIVA